MAENPVALIDLTTQRDRIRSRIDATIAKVLAHGRFIMGPEIEELEARLCAFTGARHCISCSSGTDALALHLMARGVGPGDAVFVPDFTFVSTAEVVIWLGATPYFVDVLPDSFNIDLTSLEVGIEDARKRGLHPKGVIPVDLFGQPVDYRTLLPLAERHGLFVLSDAAQSFGASLDGQPVGRFGEATATSFYPSKPLGCYGDGGALFTDDDDLADTIRSLRIHGQGTSQYDNIRVGMNGRMDTLQAAILLAKMDVFSEELAARSEVATRYEESLHDVVQTPRLTEGAVSAWAQYTLVLEQRDKVRAACQAAGVATAVYYPIPLSRQKAYANCPCVPGGVPVAERLSETVLSLPMHPYLDQAAQERVAAAVRKGVA